MIIAWTDADDEILVRSRKGGLSFPEIAEQLPGRSPSACRNRYSRIATSFPQETEVRASKERQTLTALEQWQAQRNKPDYMEILEHAKRGADLQRRMRPRETRATRRITCDETGIFVVFMSDFHLGAPGCNVDAFISTTELLLSDPRVFFAVVGPDLETAFAWFYSADAVLNQTIPPYMQIEVFRQWLDKMMPRCLATCGDTHTDQRLLRMLGDIGLIWRDDLPYFRSYGLLNIELCMPGAEPVSYLSLMKHEHKGHSIYHNLQPALRAMRDIHPLCDVYVIGHTHEPAYMNNVYFPEARPAKPRQHFIITGTFKEADAYSEYYFGAGGTLGLPTLWLDPLGHNIAFFDSPELALKLCGR